jgi:hypothetical protein
MLHKGEPHIASQERRTADMDRRGHDTTEARQSLEMFRASQKQHIAPSRHDP